MSQVSGRIEGSNLGSSRLFGATRASTGTAVASTAALDGRRYVRRLAITDFVIIAFASVLPEVFVLVGGRINGGTQELTEHFILTGAVEHWLGF